MNYSFKYIITFFTLYFLISCISIKDIHRTYQKGIEAKERQYNENKENLPLLSFGEQEEEDERRKIEGLISKTIDSLNIPLDGLIIINYFIEYPNETYSFFPKDSEDFYSFNNILYAPTQLKVFSESKKSSNKEAIINVYNYFNSSEYKEKRLNMDFCEGYSRLSLSVLKIENKKIKLFYLDPLAMCKNNNAFETLKGDEIVRWEFGNSE